MTIEKNRGEPTGDTQAAHDPHGTSQRSSTHKKNNAPTKTLEELIQETPKDSVDRAWQEIRDVGREIS